MTADEAIALLYSWVEYPACDQALANEVFDAVIEWDTDRTVETTARLGKAASAYNRATRTLVRCQMGGMGADWDLADAQAEIRRATELRRLSADSFSARVFGPGVVAIVNGKTRVFGARGESDT